MLPRVSRRLFAAAARPLTRHAHMQPHMPHIMPSPRVAMSARCFSMMTLRRSDAPSSAPSTPASSAPPAAAATAAAAAPAAAAPKATPPPDDLIPGMKPEDAYELPWKFGEDPTRIRKREGWEPYAWCVLFCYGLFAFITIYGPNTSPYQWAREEALHTGFKVPDVAPDLEDD